jgi:hypothetical protein
MPVRVPDGELAERLVAADHGCLDRSARRLTEIGAQNAEDEPTDVGKQATVVSKEGAEDLGDGPDELTMGQVEKEVPAEVLPQKEGPLLGAGGYGMLATS